MKSPCVGVCQFDQETGFCKACLRTRPEAKGWKKLSEAAQSEIVAARPGRKAELRLAKKARKAIKKADKLAKPAKLHKAEKSGKSVDSKEFKELKKPKKPKKLKKSDQLAGSKNRAVSRDLKKSARKGSAQARESVA